MINDQNLYRLLLRVQFQTKLGHCVPQSRRQGCSFIGDIGLVQRDLYPKIESFVETTAIDHELAKRSCQVVRQIGHRDILSGDLESQGFTVW